MLGVVDKGWVALQIRQPRKEELQDSEAPVRPATEALNQHVQLTLQAVALQVEWKVYSMAQDKKSATKFVDAVLKSVKAHEDYEEKAFAMAKDKVHSRKPEDWLASCDVLIRVCRRRT